MNELDIVSRTKEFATDILVNKLPEELTYHNLSHTEEVVSSAMQIADLSSLDADSNEILMVAAWLHDIGYTKTYDDHEARSIEMALPFLQEQNYPEEKVAAVVQCIEATKMPQSPKNLICEIICDSDLANLGKESYFRNSQLIRDEWATRCPEKDKKGDWLSHEIEFLEGHTYFTQAAKDLFQSKKEENIKTLKAMQQEVPQTPANVETKPPASKKKDKSVKKKKDFGRGVETMYRTAYKTHISLSAIADNKANILLSINAIIISITLTALIPKLDNNSYLLMPTMVLLLVCITTIVFATLSTRPKVSMGKSTKEDIAV